MVSTPDRVAASVFKGCVDPGDLPCGILGDTGGDLKATGCIGSNDRVVCCEEHHFYYGRGTAAGSTSGDRVSEGLLFLKALLTLVLSPYYSLTPKYSLIILIFRLCYLVSSFRTSAA